MIHFKTVEFSVEEDSGVLFYLWEIYGVNYGKDMLHGMGKLCHMRLGRWAMGNLCYMIWSQYGKSMVQNVLHRLVL